MSLHAVQAGDGDLEGFEIVNYMIAWLDEKLLN